MQIGCTLNIEICNTQLNFYMNNTSTQSFFLSQIYRISTTLIPKLAYQFKQLTVEDVEDIVYSKFERLTQSNTFYNWLTLKHKELENILFITYKRSILDYLRSSYFRSTTHIDEWYEHTLGSNGSNKTEHTFNPNEVLRKVAIQLKPNQQKILYLKYGDGLRNKEIAKLLGIPENNISSLVRTIKQHLRKELKHYGYIKA